MRKQVLIVAIVMVLTSQVSRASSITLTSSGGGFYNYALSVAPNEVVTFNLTQTIDLSGMAGVVGAGASGDLVQCFSPLSFSSSNVEFVTKSTPCSFSGGASGMAFGNFEIQSSVLTLGAINFNMQTANEGTVTGNTQGPSTVPEPCSLLIVGAGLLALIGVRRRKLIH